MYPRVDGLLLLYPRVEGLRVITRLEFGGLLLSFFFSLLPSSRPIISPTRLYYTVLHHITFEPRLSTARRRRQPTAKTTLTNQARKTRTQTRATNPTKPKAPTDGGKPTKSPTTTRTTGGTTGTRRTNTTQEPKTDRTQRRAATPKRASTRRRRQPTPARPQPTTTAKATTTPKATTQPERARTPTRTATTAEATNNTARRTKHRTQPTPPKAPKHRTEPPPPQRRTDVAPAETSERKGALARLCRCTPCVSRSFRRYNGSAVCGVHHRTTFREKKTAMAALADKACFFLSGMRPRLSFATTPPRKKRTLDRRVSLFFVGGNYTAVID